MKKTTVGVRGAAASRKIDDRIHELGDWRGETLAHLRKLIHDVDPQVVEEWKWMGTPVWSHDGGICTGESYKEWVKLTFFKGAVLSDPKKLFNSSLDGNVRRAIDIRQGEKLDEGAFKALIREAIEANTSKKKAKKAPAKSAPTKRAATKKAAPRKAAPKKAPTKKAGPVKAGSKKAPAKKPKK